MLFRKAVPAVAGAIVFSFMTTGCATKKFVRQTTTPIQNQVTDLEAKSGKHQTHLGEIDLNVARVDEKAMEADRKAAAAGQAADRAGQAAAAAQQTANSATTLAQQGLDKAGQVDTRVTSLVTNFDSYKLANTEKIYFDFGRADLSKDEKAKLDQAIQNLESSKNYIIEVAGYADRTGTKDLNLLLSRQRADAVVRYLTVEHQVPLRRIHDIGAGSDFPNADNSTRDARKENRRVDVKVYTFSGDSVKTN